MEHRTLLSHLSVTHIAFSMDPIGIFTKQFRFNFLFGFQNSLKDIDHLIENIKCQLGTRMQIKSRSDYGVQLLFLKGTTPLPAMQGPIGKCKYNGNKVYSITAYWKDNILTLMAMNGNNKYSIYDSYLSQLKQLVSSISYAFLHLELRISSLQLQNSIKHKILLNISCSQ